MAGKPSNRVLCRCEQCGEEGKLLDTVAWLRHNGQTKSSVNRWCVSARGMMEPKEEG